MIKGFLFEKFKGFDKACLMLESVTTMIGTNASGKSNAIEGVQILSELSAGLELSVIFDGTKSNESSIRGGAKGCCRFGAQSFTLGCLLDLDKSHDLLYRVKIGVTDRITIDDESLYVVKNGSIDAQNAYLIFKAAANSDSGDIYVEYSNGKRGKNPQFRAIRSMSVLAQMQGKLPADIENYEDSISKVQAARDGLTSIHIIDPIPALMRGYSRIADTSLRRNCSNISAVLYSLAQRKIDEWARFKDVVKSLPENEIKDISFVDTLLNDVILIQKEESGKRTESIDAARLSDGTLRCIAALAAIMSEPEHSLIVIEELDNGIHPGRMRKLLNALTEIARKRNVDLLFTTHNVTLLNGLNKQDVLGVSVIYRDADTQASRIIPFVDIKRQAGLLAIGGIGDAFATEMLLRAIKDRDEVKPFDF